MDRTDVTRSARGGEQGERWRKETKFNINEGVGKMCQRQKESQCYHLARTANKPAWETGKVVPSMPGFQVALLTNE